MSAATCQGNPDSALNNHGVENADYAAMLRRMLRAYGRRVADGDVEDLRDMLALETELREAIRHAVTELRAQQGYSWAAIARGTGTTRQSAQERWGT